MNGDAVVLKAADGANRTEALLYADHLGLRQLAPRHLGVFDDTDSGLVWIVLEDVRSFSVDPHTVEHRIAAGSWIAALHSTATPSDLASRLPNRDTDYYELEARLTAQRVSAFATTLGPRDPAVDAAKRALCALGELDTSWAIVRRWLEGSPKVVVHGDLSPKNVAVTANGDFSVIDWREAGWGAPAIDLAQDRDWALAPDLTAYLDAVGELTPWTSCDWERVAAVGDLMRGVMALSWVTWSMEAQSRDRVRRRLEACTAYLNRSMRSLGFASS